MRRLIFSALLAAAAAGAQSIPLWPHGAPGGSAANGPERDSTTPQDPLVAGRRATRLANVSNPEILLRRPPKDKDTGAAVLVCPGGGYSVLVIDVGGEEPAAWLNSIGVTAAILKYRVPQPPNAPAYAAPLQDAQRAMSVLRSRAKEWGIDPTRIGVLGFSAGGHLAAALSDNFDKRTYSAVDAADQTPTRPAFTMLVYPYLARDTSGREISPELHVASRTPPAFLVQTEDDPVHVENSVFYYLALKSAKVPAEMHLFSSGGHGYGLRLTNERVGTWPALAEQWLRSLGVLGSSGRR